MRDLNTFRIEQNSLLLKLNLILNSGTGQSLSGITGGKSGGKPEDKLKEEGKKLLKKFKFGK